MHRDAWEARESMKDAWACMGGKEKHERRMGMHGEARKSMIDAWACMGGKGKHDRCMGMHGRQGKA